MRNNEVFTTGEVAQICKVASRTVATWIDSGRLRGYRIPGSLDRRVPRNALVQFCEQNGLPFQVPQDALTIVVVGNGHMITIGNALRNTASAAQIDSCESLFLAGYKVAKEGTKVLVVSPDELGLVEALNTIHEQHIAVGVIAISKRGRAGSRHLHGIDEWFDTTSDPRGILEKALLLARRTR